MHILVGDQQTDNISTYILYITNIAFGQFLRQYYNLLLTKKNWVFIAQQKEIFYSATNERPWLFHTFCWPNTLNFVGLF